MSDKNLTAPAHLDLHSDSSSRANAHTHSHAHTHTGEQGHAHRHDHQAHGHHGPSVTSAAAGNCTPAKGVAGCCDCGTIDLSFGKRKAAQANAHNHEGHDHASEGGDDHGHDHGALPGWGRIGAALVAAVAAEAFHWASGEPGSANYDVLHYGGMALALVAIALSGLGVYKAGIKGLLQLKLGIHALMAVAVTGAFIIGQWPEAAMVMALYAAAERIEDMAMDRARNAIRDLLNLAPQEADVVLPDGSTQRMLAADVRMGSVVRIAPGARVPLDGTVSQGQSAVDQAPITGESTLAEKSVGDPLYAGSVNQQGELQMRVDAAPEQSLISRIVRAVEEAQASKAPTQRFVDRFAAIYTPIVLLLGIALAVIAPFAMGWTWTQSIYQALALLVIACPCALVISTPVTVVSALTVAAKNGVLIKGGSALEGARNLRAIAMDKTGTLTTGQPQLMGVQVWGNLPSGDEERIAWQLASRSDHPVSRAIANGLESSFAHTSSHNTQDVEALPGRGMAGTVDGSRYVLGNLRLMREMGIASETLEEALQRHEQQGHSVTLLADERSVHAIFAVADPLRAQAPEAVRQLQTVGVQPVVLSGDNGTTVATIASQAGISRAQGNLLPEDKLRILGEMQTSTGPTAMVGDGINDAPALAKADLAFAMGGTHATDMAMETADVVLMNDDLRRIPQTVALSRHAHGVLWQNITLALGVKVVFFVLALTGNASMWMAVVADMGVSLLVVANGLRLRLWKGFAQ
ncbi:heavy metal translocating P-type ATPase [Comamonas odontotermitis]|uniref:heavy metal translocating P-type ATPase n=1 Tax=Comamonas odontotermitis TaxID=379895 RepID=UPI001CC6482C|nr:heavy metal translocating P-type ATPase [Comamonas odontotermitis]UBB18529.1 heavy metal translocating P-type ATPase [Comamonas odontotermitis]